MSSKLVIVESPTKAKTITRFLGNSVQVMASQGHIRDLPEHALGVDVDHNFTPEYELTPNGKKIAVQLKQAARGASDIYLATDPDREGEAIAWHLEEVLKPSSKAAFHRITFHEITQSAIQHSFQTPGQIDLHMVDAQQARRVLDRIVGYQVSPLLWRNIHGATSAGRVQTVALRLVVEREQEIKAFVPVESWNLDACFETAVPKSTIKARLAKINGSNVKISNGEDAAKVADALQSNGVSHKVSKVTSTPRTKNPPPPFITSTLQQAAGSNLGLGASQTMRIAQELYEGIDLGSGQVGLITYMRTDSFNIAKEAQSQALAYIATKYGPEYVPAKPNTYHAGKNAQEAHEAIRPTSMEYAPELIKSHLTPQQLKVYTIIWNRFIASQMASAKQMDHLIEINSDGGALATTGASGLTVKQDTSTGLVCTFRATARETIFPGFLMAYKFREVGDDEEDPQLNTLPKLPLDTPCSLRDLKREQTFSQPPPRYSEASLVKALEQNGVGRPSTYATTVNTIQEREYVNKTGGSLVPTELGFKVCEFLLKQIQTLFEVRFTAEMENELDQIEEGKLNWTDMLTSFYEKFKSWLGMHSLSSSSDNAIIVENILKCFPPDFKYAEPVSKGHRKYDDAKFMESIREHLATRNTLSERQWNALLTTALRYSDDHPEILKVMQENGLASEAEAILADIKRSEESLKIPVAPEALALLDAMSKLKFSTPSPKSKKRHFDDGKFIKSLAKQAESGKALTEAQSRALLKLAANYSAMIPDYQKLTEALAATLPQTDENPVVVQPQQEMSEADKSTITTLLGLAAEIPSDKWKIPRGKFNDQSFVDSIKQQFEQRGTLTPKQISALMKTISKYADVIPNYAERAKNLNMPQPQSKANVLDTPCPLCGAQLVKRFSRGRSFIACSAYPKCKYTQSVNASSAPQSSTPKA
ncbi:MAG: type I DNA topoisomerase [Victivallales bacterium]|nr:type I DNA topoisomerase [Victivallales bacterium]